MSLSVPVLMYHCVDDELRDSRDVSLRTFESHVRYIAENGYTSLTAMELYKALKGETPMPPKPVCITFDDGFRDNYTNAFPILKKYKVKAICFVVSSRGGDDEPDFMSWDEIREMDASGIIDIESHTHRHRKNNLDIFERGGEEEILEDLVTSRRILEKELGRECRFLAWPQGHYNAEMIKLAERAGYYITFTTENGPNVSLDEGKIRRFKVKERSVFWLRVRLLLYGNSTLASLYARLKGIKFRFSSLFFTPFTSIIIFFLLFPYFAYAHPGRTDQRGGHKCRKDCMEWDLRAGEYHLHDKDWNPIRLDKKGNPIKQIRPEQTPVAVPKDQTEPAQANEMQGLPAEENRVSATAEPEKITIREQIYKIVVYKESVLPFSCFLLLILAILLLLALVLIRKKREKE